MERRASGVFRPWQPALTPAGPTPDQAPTSSARVRRLRAPRAAPPSGSWVLWLASP
jgi:hypothetical protein